MSSNTKADRRDRTRNEIKKLIEERNSVLSLYYELVKSAEQFTEDTTTTAGLLEDFCQEMVDYLAKGHFEIYRRIEEGTERRTNIAHLAKQILQHIHNTTDVAVEFNDTYENAQANQETFKSLPVHLEKLGKALATRVDLEDQFINTLLQNNTAANDAIPA
jgi:regulator of sigma D